ncbi:hypothetical protein GLUCOINTEAF2_0203911 [Komagataeibacter intermedius AF2]|uniref:Uncharacterized protein n=1 Tax=Komagataeibacter intermedius AF2 TaxID=1458464 RepID=A0A0N1FBR9_9PROT|nr:hypothetical protein GLUCOINTEAF2_0203911 [Komagataeibacter intermedius AF2]
MARAHAAITADIKVPAILGRDHAHVLALCLRAFAGTAGHGEFELVRGAQALVAVFQIQRLAHAVLHAIAAPCAAHAGFYGPGGFAICLSGLESCFQQFTPDIGQLFQPRAEQVDALAAGDLGIQAVFLCHLTKYDQLLRRDLAARDAGYDRIGAVFLHVGHERVVRVLQRDIERVRNRPVPGRCQDRTDSGLAGVTAQAAIAVLRHQVFKRLDAMHADKGIQFLPRIGKMFAQAMVDRNAARFEFGLEHVLEQGRTATTARAGLRGLLQAGKIRAAPLDGGADRPLCHVVARTDHGRIRQRVRPQQIGPLPARQDQGRRVRRGSDGVLYILHDRVVIGVVPHQHGAEYMAAIRREYEAAVGPVHFPDEAVAPAAGCRAMRIANRADIHPQQLELGGHVRPGKRGVFPRQGGRDRARHGVARRHQPEHLPVPACAFPDCVDCRVGRTALPVDHDAAAWSDGQPAVTRQPVLRADACGKHDQIGFKERAVGKDKPVAVCLARGDPLRGMGCQHLDPQCLDPLLQGLAAVVIKLHRHEARREFDNGRGQPQPRQRVGGLQPQQSAANDHAMRRAFCRCPDHVKMGWTASMRHQCAMLGSE